jgi:tetratricopeptide (TPR) repeat protein
LAEATKHRLTAVQLATPLASHQRVVLRRQARQLLIHAYLGLARDIAAGDWSDKKEVVNKWLRGAGEIAEALIEQDGADESLRFLVLRESLAAHADVDENNKELAVDVALDMGQRLLESAGDPLYQATIRQQVAKLQFDAARIMLARQDAAKSRDLAHHAAALCDDLLKDRELSPSDEDWVGRLYFYLGSLYALQERNHREAVRWYERGLPLLTKTAPREASSALGRHGERFVSMGVSYWAVGARNEAIRLTKDGIDAMEKASRSGHFARQELAVPYTNLASMYQSLGKHAEARRMSSLAQKIEAAKDTSPQ